MSHRRDQKEALRREREAREQQARAAEQRKKMVGYGAAAAIAIIAVAVAILLLTGGDDAGSGPGNAGNVFPDGGSFPEQKVFDIGPAAKAAGCQLQTKKGTARGHTTSLSDRVKYNTNPPTTGRHYEIPAQDGIYGEAPQDEQLVHNMEHGRVIIWALRSGRHRLGCGPGAKRHGRTAPLQRRERQDVRRAAGVPRRAPFARPRADSVGKKPCKAAICSNSCGSATG